MSTETINDVLAERDALREAVKVSSERLADLARKSYGLAIDADQDWVRAHIVKTHALVNAAVTSRASRQSDV